VTTLLVIAWHAYHWSRLTIRTMLGSAFSSPPFGICALAVHTLRGSYTAEVVAANTPAHEINEHALNHESQGQFLEHR